MITTKELREGQERSNELVYFLLNIGDVIKHHRIKKGLRIQDVSRKVQEKYGEEIHPSILSRYENKKLPIKNHHAAYLLDILEIYLEDVFPSKVILLDLRHFITSLKFQYLVKQLRKFFTDEQIMKMIHDFLEERLNYAYTIIHIYKEISKNQQVSDDSVDNSQKDS